ERVLKTGKSDQFEITYIGSQEPIYFDNRVAAVKHEGQVIGLTVSSRDITARKKAELLKDRLMAIVEETSDFIAMADVNGQALYLNKAGRQMMGFPADLNITETAIPDYHTKEEAEKVLTEILPFVSQFGIWSGELKFLNREGHEFPTTTVLLAHKSPDGEVEFYSAIARDISDRINAEKKILESQTMLQLIMDTIPVRVFWKDTHGHYLGCNRLFARDAGLETQNELIGKDDYDLFPAQAELYRADDKQVMETGIPKLNYEEPQGTPEGKTIWLETSKTPLRDTLGQIVGMLGSYYDITDRKRVEDIISTLAKQSSSLSNDDEFFKECLRNLGEFYNTKFVFIGLLSNEKQTHVQSYLVWNEGEFGGSFEYALEGTPCEDVINSSSNLVSEGVASLYPKDQMLIDMGLDSYYGAALVLPSKEVFGLVVVTDTKPLTLEPWAKPILEIYATRIAIEMERKRIEDELHGMATTMSYQATHDPLTDLINRREFEQRLQTALKVSKLEGHEHVLCYLDLDQFKVVNDTCGHFAGDELLKLLAEQLHTAIRESDTLARLGGDEFGVLLQDCPIEKAVNIAENLLNVVKGFRFAWEDKLFEIGVSIGLVTIDRKTLSINQALSAADAACYLAKELGRNRIHIYQEDDTELAKRHGEMQIVSDITQALEEERFVLYSQSIIPLKHLDSSEKHFEVLIRMQDRENKLILPGNFIGAAERYNLMPSLDKWVIENTFKYMSTLKKGDSFGIDLCAINLSGTTLSDDKFIDYMHKLLDTYKLPPELICFEITETAAITNITKAMNFISRFKDIGFRFSLDDFGAGLSSYSYLKNLPVDFIKIDGSFVSGIANDPLNRSIVESITQVGHTMGIQIIAEWVDSEGVLKILTEIGVDYAQGFSIDKPAPLVKN
ncbi:MAG: EAL domain-containing protein, partial [Thioalkalispiraceae bacterium]